MVIWGGSAGIKVGWKLIEAGASHFLTTTAILVNNGGSWDAASNYAGFSSPTININVDSWFDGKPDKNGINQNNPTVTPKSDTDGNSGGNNGNGRGNGGGRDTFNSVSNYTGLFGDIAKTADFNGRYYFSDMDNTYFDLKNFSKWVKTCKQTPQK